MPGSRRPQNLKDISTLLKLPPSFSIEFQAESIYGSLNPERDDSIAKAVLKQFEKHTVLCIIVGGVGALHMPEKFGTWRQMSFAGNSKISVSQTAYMRLSPPRPAFLLS